MGRFIIKKISNMKPQKKAHVATKNVNEATASEKKKQNNEAVNEEVMTTSEKIAMAQEVLGNAAPKRLKKDKGLIERTESSKIILTEDNKELLKD